LANEGIECFLTNENYTSLYPGRNNWIGHGIQIMVKEIDLEKARVIIKDILEPQITEVLCPHCKSQNIVIGSANPLLRLFSIMLAIMAAFPFGTPKPKFYCRNCGRKF